MRVCSVLVLLVCGCAEFPDPQGESGVEAEARPDGGADARPDRGSDAVSDQGPDARPDQGSDAMPDQGRSSVPDLGPDGPDALGQDPDVGPDPVDGGRPREVGPGREAGLEDPDGSAPLDQGLGPDGAVDPPRCPWNPYEVLWTVGPGGLAGHRWTGGGPEQAAIHDAHAGARVRLADDGLSAYVVNSDATRLRSIDLRTGEAVDIELRAGAPQATLLALDVRAGRVLLALSVGEETHVTLHAVDDGAALDLGPEDGIGAAVVGGASDIALTSEGRIFVAGAQAGAVLELSLGGVEPPVVHELGVPAPVLALDAPTTGGLYAAAASRVWWFRLAEDEDPVSIDLFDPVGDDSAVVLKVASVPDHPRRVAALVRGQLGVACHEQLVLVDFDANDEAWRGDAPLGASCDATWRVVTTSDGALVAALSDSTLHFVEGETGVVLGAAELAPGALDLAARGAANTERCTRVDDDCDGAVDEGFDVGAACHGRGICDSDGAIACVDPQTARCSAELRDSDPAPVDESCNGLDDDCNGVVDDVAARSRGVGRMFPDAFLAHARPALTWMPEHERYFVAWEEQQVSWDIFAQELDLTGTPRGERLTVGENASDEVRAAVAWGAGQLAVAYNIERHGLVQDDDSFLRRFDRAGRELQVAHIGSPQLNSHRIVRPDVKWARDQWAVTQRMGNIAHATFFTPDDAPPAAGVELRAPACCHVGRRIAIDAAPNGEVLALFQASPDPLRLTVQPLNAAHGAIGDGRGLPEGPVFGDADVAWGEDDGSSSWAVAWTTEGTTEGRPLFRRLNRPADAWLSQTVDLGGPDGAHAPSVVWTGYEWGIVWQAGEAGARRIYFARVAPDGTPRELGVPVSDGARDAMDADIAWSGELFLIAWTEFRDGQAEIWRARGELGCSLRHQAPPQP